MVWFILYVIFGLQTTFVCSLIEYNEKVRVDSETMLVQFCFWPFVVATGLYLMIKDKQ